MAIGALGSSAFRYEARPKGHIVGPPEALKFDLFDSCEEFGISFRLKNSEPVRFNNILLLLH
jgi:hypothetical protein